MALAVEATVPPSNLIASSLRMAALNHGSRHVATMVHARAYRIATMVEYCDRLKEAMTDEHVTVAALAAHMNLSYQAVKKVLDGKTNAFTASNNDIAARFLKVSPSWLATGRLPKRPAASTAAAEAGPASIEAGLSPRALSLAKRFDGLTEPAAAATAYARLSNILDVYEAEQREAAYQEPAAPIATPSPRNRPRQTSPSR